MYLVIPTKQRTRSYENLNLKKWPFFRNLVLARKFTMGTFPKVIKRPGQEGVLHRNVTDHIREKRWTQWPASLSCSALLYSALSPVRCFSVLFSQACSLTPPLHTSAAAAALPQLTTFSMGSSLIQDPARLHARPSVTSKSIPVQAPQSVQAHSAEATVKPFRPHSGRNLHIRRRRCRMETRPRLFPRPRPGPRPRPRPGLPLWGEEWVAGQMAALGDSGRTRENVHYGHRPGPVEKSKTLLLYAVLGAAVSAVWSYL